MTFCSKLRDVDDSAGIKSPFQIVPEERYPVQPSFLNSIRDRGFEINVHDLNHDGHLFANREVFLRGALPLDFRNCGNKLLERRERLARRLGLDLLIHGVPPSVCMVNPDSSSYLVLIEPLQQQGSQPRVGTGDPKASNLRLLVEIIAAEHFVRAFARQDYLVTFLTDQSRRPEQRCGVRSKYGLFRVVNGVWKLAADVLVGAVDGVMV